MLSVVKNISLAMVKLTNAGTAGERNLLIGGIDMSRKRTKIDWEVLGFDIVMGIWYAFLALVMLGTAGFILGLIWKGLQWTWGS